MFLTKLQKVFFSFLFDYPSHHRVLILLLSFNTKALLITTLICTQKTNLTNSKQIQSQLLSCTIKEYPSLYTYRQTTIIVLLSVQYYTSLYKACLCFRYRLSSVGHLSLILCCARAQCGNKQYVDINHKCCCSKYSANIYHVKIFTINASPNRKTSVTNFCKTL